MFNTPVKALCRHRLKFIAAALYAITGIAITFQPAHAAMLSESSCRNLYQDSSTLTILTSELPRGMEGVYYDFALKVTGGTGTYYWSVADGSLPSNLKLSEDGVISGTPRQASTYNFTIQVTDSQSHTSASSYSLIIRSKVATTPVISTLSLPSGAVNIRYATALTATGGSGEYTWKITLGNLPDGLSLSSSGLISGAPARVQTGQFTVKVTDSDLLSSSKELFLAIYATPEASLTVVSGTLPNGVVGAYYSETLQVSGGTGDYTWEISSGSLPDGLTLSSTGVIQGTPTSAGNSSFTVLISDPSSLTSSKTYSISIAAADYTHVAISTTSLPPGTTGTYYNNTLMATGGAGGYTWKVLSGNLPDGLRLTDKGVIFGTPATAAEYEVTIGVCDVNSITASNKYIVTIKDAPSPTTTTPTPSENTSSQQREPAPDLISFSRLTATPSSVTAGDAVEISLTATNSGQPEITGTVMLKIDGAEEAQQEITLAAGQSQTVTFTVNRSEPGSYTATVDPLSTGFTVTAPGADYSGLITGIAVTVLGLLVAWRIYAIRRKSPPDEFD